MALMPEMPQPRGTRGDWWQTEVHPQDDQPPVQRHLADMCVRGCEGQGCSYK